MSDAPTRSTPRTTGPAQSGAGVGGPNGTSEADLSSTQADTTAGAGDDAGAGPGPDGNDTTPKIPGRSKVRPGDRIFQSLSSGSAVFISILIAAIGVFLVWRAVPALSRNEANFLTSREWVTVDIEHMSFGVLDLLQVTILVSLFALVLAMPVAEAEKFFGAGEARTPAAHKILERLADVGLGYLTLGQPLTTLSGGERQRLKLAVNMGEKGRIYVLDEPTTGLHLADVEQLLALLDRLVDSGLSVIVIEHHQAVMAHADRIIDLGPGAGYDGGRVVFEGTPAELVADASTLTGQHLAAYVGG